MRLKTTLLATTLIALPLMAANAQPVSGPYVSAGAGVNFLQNQTFSASTNPFTVFGGEGGGEQARALGSDEGLVRGSNRGSARTGFVGLGSIGWGFGNGFRAELEGSWRDNRIHGNSGTGSVSVGSQTEPLSPTYNSGVRGRSSQYAVMVNALFDMNIGLNWMYPYIGGGVGYSWQRFNGLNGGVNGDLFGGEGGGGGTFWRSNDTAGSFAYQAIAGAAFPIMQIPGLSLTAEYRFMGTVGAQNLSARGSGGFETFDAGGEGNITRARVSEAHNHSILLGVRYAFNAAPAALIAAPAAIAPAGKSFLVFFDWDKSTLTDRARGIIREAAATSKSTAHTRMEVNGSADTSGNPRYNQGLSMRRAQTVAAELVRNGVARGEIAIKAFGDTVLLVPTGPGVREPQNRRVEIIIR